MNILYYVKMSLRGMKKNTFHSFIAIWGLSLAFTCSFFVFSWFKYELSYDTFYKDSDHIFQLNAYLKDANEVWRTTPLALYPHLKALPEVEAVVTQQLTVFNFSVDETKSADVNLLQTYSDFFGVFPQKFLIRSGDHFTSTDIVVTKDFVMKTWGTSDVIGKKVGDFVIKGIIETPPVNSNLVFDAIVVLEPSPVESGNWNEYNYSTFLRLDKKTDIKAFEKKIQTSVFNPKSNVSYDIVPIHLVKYMLQEDSFLQAFGFLIVLSVALCLLFLSALFNFVMLTISHFLSRLKTYAIHKSMGATGIQLAGILYGEILFSLFIVFLLTCILVQVTYPWMVSFTQLPIENTFIHIEFLKYMSVGMLVVCIFSGYPVIYIRLLTLKRMLIGTTQGGKGGLDIWMIGLQIVVTIVFSFFMVGMILQFRHMTNTGLGYTTHNIDRLKIESENVKKNITPFINELKSHRIIKDVIWCDYDLFREKSFYSVSKAKDFLQKEDFNQNDNRVIYCFPMMRESFPFFEFQLKSGRVWNNEDQGGLNEVVVNEMLVKEFGEKDIIGKIKSFSNTPVKVVGIVKDFYNQPMNEPIHPAVYVNTWVKQWNGGGIPTVCYFKYAPGERQAAAKIVRQVYSHFSQGEVPEIMSFTSYVSTYYQKEQRMMLIFLIVAVVSLFITILGLYALISFKLYRRRQEIAIRKIHGASRIQIMGVLMKQYAYLVLIASLIAFPVVFYALDQWLMQYKSRVEIGVLHVLGVLFFIVLVVVLTIIGQVLKTTRINPVEAIKENN